MKGEEIHSRTWNDPAWGKSVFFVKELKFNFFRFLFYNKKYYLLLYIFAFIPVGFFKYYTKQHHDFSDLFQLYVSVLFYTNIFAIIYLIRIAIEDFYIYKFKNYLEMMEQGFYFWDLGFINSAHPFFPYSQMTSADAIDSKSYCKLNLTFSHHKDPIELKIPKSDIGKILDIPALKNDPDHKLVVALRSIDV